jgi:hypothetical protein
MALRFHRLATVATLGACAWVTVGCRPSTNAQSSPAQTQSSSQAKTDASDGRPCVLRGQLAVEHRFKAPSGIELWHRTQAYATFESAATCVGAAETLNIRMTEPLKLRGHAYANGHHYSTSSKGSLEADYIKSAHVSDFSTDEEAIGVYLRGPEQSKIGAGQSMTIEVSAVLKGTGKTVITTVDEEFGEGKSYVKVPGRTVVQDWVDIAMPYYVKNNSPEPDKLKIALVIEPTPGVATKPEYESLIPRLKEALGQPYGQVKLVFLGQVYGADTTYRNDGHMAMSYFRDHMLPTDSGGENALLINFVAWTTEASDNWQPKVLPAADKPPEASPK